MKKNKRGQKIKRRSKPENSKIYKRLISEMIKAQAEVLGSEIALKKARKISEFKIDDDFKVSSLNGDPIYAVQSLVNEYFCLSAESAVKISSRVAKRFLAEHPNLKLPRSLIAFKEN